MTATIPGIAATPAGTTDRRSGRAVVPAVVVVGGVLALLGRGVEHLLHPTFWAEDGAVFYSQGRAMGLASLTQPYAGYLHLLPRLLSLPIVALPVRWGPAATVWTAVVADGLLMATVLTPRLRWLVASPTWRAVLFLLVVLLPDQYETLDNLANLIFVGGIALAVIALSDPPRTRTGRVAEVAAVVVLGLSGPIVLLLVPLFAYRVGRTRSVQAWLTAVTALGCGVVQLVVYLVSDRAGGAGGATVRVYVEVLLARGPGSWIFGPQLAERVVHRAGPLHLLAVLPVLWLVAAVVAVGVTRRFWFTATIAVTVVLLFAAPTWAYGTRMYPALGSNRHVVVPTMLLVTALVAAASPLGHRAPAGPRRWPAVVAVVLLASGVLGVTTLVPARSWTQPTDTARLARCLASPAPVCSTPISPPGYGWTVVVRGPVAH